MSSLSVLWSSAIVRRGSGSLLAGGFATLAAAVLQLVFARVLGVEQYGVFAYSLAWVALLSSVGKLGLDSASLRFVPSYIVQGNWANLTGFMRASLTMTLLVTAVVSVIAGLVFFTTGALPGRVIAFTCAMIPVLACVELVGSWLQALKRPASYQLIYGTVRPIIAIATLLSCLAWLIPPTASIGLAALVFASVGALVVLSISVRRAWPQVEGSPPPRYPAAEWWQTGWPLYLVALCQMLLARVDILLVGALAGPAQAGVYAVVSQLAALVLFGISASNAVMAPVISETFTKGDARAMRQALVDSSKLVLAYTVPVLAVLVLLGQSLLSLFGEEFTVGYAALVILSCGYSVVAFLGPVGFLLTMTGHQRSALAVVLAAACAQVVLCVVLIPNLGIIGAAIAGGASNAIRSIVMLGIVRHRMRLI